MNKKIKNILKISFCIIVIISLIFSLFISQDKHHLITCHEAECVECAVIHVAQTIMQVAFSICVCFMVSFLIYYVLSRLRKSKEFVLRTSPVCLKIQLNE